MSEPGPIDRDAWIDADLASRDPARSQAHVGVDPFLEDFYRAPYDPLYGAQALGRLTGEVVRDPSGYGWVGTVLTSMLAAALLTIGASGLALALGWGPSLATNGEQRLMETLRVNVFTGPFGVAGILLLIRLVRDRAA